MKVASFSGSSARFRFPAMTRLLFFLIVALVPRLHAAWHCSGPATISGPASELASAATLEVPAPGVPATARFGPLVIDPAARELNLQAEVAAAIPAGKAFRVTLYLTHDAAFPEQARSVLARGNRSVKGGERGIVAFNLPMPRQALAGKPVHAFVEVSSADLDRRGRPGPPAAGKLLVRAPHPRPPPPPAPARRPPASCSSGASTCFPAACPPRRRSRPAAARSSNSPAARPPPDLSAASTPSRPSGCPACSPPSSR